MEVQRVKYRRRSIREVEYQPRHPAHRAAKVIVHPECRRSIYIANAGMLLISRCPDTLISLSLNTINARINSEHIHKGNICGKSSAFLGIFTHSADGYGLVGA